MSAGPPSSLFSLSTLLGRVEGDSRAPPALIARLLLRLLREFVFFQITKERLCYDEAPACRVGALLSDVIR